MTASFLRASLFTSVVAFGVAALAAGLGVVFILLGLALLSIYRASRAIPAAAGVAATGPAAAPAPESAAGGAPESAPESAPGSAPESEPGPAPESAPESAPGPPRESE